MEKEIQIKPTSFLIQLYSVMMSENSSRYPTLEKYIFTQHELASVVEWKISVHTHETIQHRTLFVYIKKIIYNVFGLFRIYFSQPKFMSYKRLATESNNTHKQCAKSTCHLPVLLDYPTFLFASSTHQFTLNVMLTCWFYEYKFAHNFFQCNGRVIIYVCSWHLTDNNRGF